MSFASIASHNGVKAVVFDMGGVLLPSPVPVFQAFEKRSNLPPGTIADLALNGGFGSAWYKLETGKITFMDFLDDFGKEIAAKTGKEPDMNLLVKIFEQILKRIDPVMLDAIRCLRADEIQVALLTNNWYVGRGTEESQLGVDGSLFDVIVESRKEGIRKPDPRIYRICMERLGVKGDEIVFLDDLGPNLKAAKQFGWKTIKVTDSNKAVKDLEDVLGVQLRGFIEGTVSVPKHLQLPLHPLEKYITDTLNITRGDTIVRSFEHGQSNPTYVVSIGGNHMVLRKKPPGKLLPSAHAVDREYRVMKAVRQHGVPVPKMLAFCDEQRVVGTEFYLMEYLNGHVFKNVSEIDIQPAERRDLYFSMIDVLCKIHSVDIKKAGLENFGKQGNFIERNFNRWAKQYEASKTGEIPSLEKLMEWIPSHIPDQERVTLVHGDFRLDNLMFFKDSAEVMGVLDWELSTLGDPLNDLASCCLFHYMPHTTPLLPGLADLDLKVLGIPTAEELVQRYCDKMNIQPIQNWDFYVAFLFFKMSAVLQGVYKRAISGQASSAKAQFARMGAEQYADLGWNIASRSNIQPVTRQAAATTRDRLKTQTMMTYLAKPMSVDRTHGTVGQMAVSVDALSPWVQDLYNRMKKFIDEHIAPIEAEMFHHSHGQDRWTMPPKIKELQQKARAEGLWNLFMPLESDPDRKYGAGLTNLEYAFFCEEMGRVPLSSYIFNCSAPDTGNMEVLVRYGTPEQKEKWLKPLLSGEIRSCFGMTEPAVASSDATNIQASIQKQGDHYVVNGHKWWTSNALHPDCKLCIFMGKTSTSGSRYRQQSMIIVPMDAPGVKIVRSLSVFGYDHAPAGHGEVLFENVRVPASNIILGEGRGFEIAQGRLGPGRIHHCMRLIGAAERALSYMIKRTQERIAFGKPLAAQGTIQADVAESRIEIEQARLLVLKAAYVMDVYGNKVAMPEISMIKVVAPRMTLQVIDRAIQAHGGAGVSDDFPLAAMFAQVRTLRFADGPDEVHRHVVSRLEYAKALASNL